jgi:RNA polymerase sigma-70 factor (ECF subfamily)
MVGDRMKASSSTEQAEAEFRRQLPGILPRLSRFAMGLTRDRSEADDVLQTACERALSRIHQWNPETRLDSWMFRIIQTIWWNELRARKVRELHVHREQAEQAPPHGKPEDQLLLLRAEQEIFRLPEALRVVLMLVCVEQLSYAEAAEVALVPIGTVMSRLARARLLLMKRLGFSADAVPRDREKAAFVADTPSRFQVDLPSPESPTDASSLSGKRTDNGSHADRGMPKPSRAMNRRTHQAKPGSS